MNPTWMQADTDDAIDAILRGLRPRHRRCLLLAAQGRSGAEIARAVGYRSRETVYRVQARHRDRLDGLVRLAEVEEFGGAASLLDDDWIPPRR